MFCFEKVRSVGVMEGRGEEQAQIFLANYHAAVTLSVARLSIAPDRVQGMHVEIHTYKFRGQRERKRILTPYIHPMWRALRG